MSYTGWRALMLFVTTSLAGACADGPGAPLEGRHTARLGGVLGDLVAKTRRGLRGEELVRHLDLVGKGGEIGLAVAFDHDAAEARGMLARAGARVHRTHGRVAVVSAPLARADELAALPGVQTLFPLARGRPQVETEALAGIGALAFHLSEPATLGAGVTVAVIDRTFAGLADATLDGELPSTTGLVCDLDGCVEGDVEANSDGTHGVDVAEVVHDLAPAADLLLVREEGGAAALPGILDELGSRGVQIALLAMSYPSIWPMDGSDGLGVHAALEDAEAQGMLVICAAGNLRQRTYDHTFSPRTGGTGHRFLAGPITSHEYNAFHARAGERVDLFLTWDEWREGDASAPVATHDFNLYLYEGASGATQVPRATSLDDIQPGQQFGGFAVQDGDDFPVEHVVFYPDTTGTYRIRVARASSLGDAPPPRLRLQLFGSGTLAYHTPMGSLGFPADGEAVLAVGAGALEERVSAPFSSEGPTADGRIKPDLVGPTGVSTSRSPDGAFAGTSAAAAHVAGLAALLYARADAPTPNSVRQELLSAAHPAGRGAPDAVYGAGLAAAPLIEPVTLEVLDPRPEQAAPVGPFDAPKTFTARLRVTTPSGANVATRVEADRLSARIGGLDAVVQQVLSLPGELRVVIEPPPQTQNGLLPLEVTLDVGGVAVTETVVDAVAYGEERSNAQVVLLIDRSGSMGGQPMEVAKQAAASFVDLLVPGDSVGVVSFASTATLDFPLTPIVVPTGDGGTPVLTEDFESGLSAWTVTGSWDTEASRGQGGSTALSDSPGTPYLAGTDASATLAQPVDTTTLSQPALRYWTEHDLERGYDFGVVEVSTDGATWAELRRLNGAGTGHVEELPLPRAAQVWVRFRMTSDSSLQYDGWWIDDIEIGEAQVSSAAGASAAIEALSAAGGTNIAAALELGLHTVQYAADQRARRAMVLLSDGVSSEGDIRALLPDIVQAGVPVYTIGLGSGAGRGILEEISTVTGGANYFTDDPEALFDIYSQIAEQVASRGLLLSQTFGLAAVGQAAQAEHPLVVDPAVDAAVFVVRWSGAEEPFRIRVRDPAGTVYDTASAAAAGFDVATEERYTQYRVNDPTPGEWALLVELPLHGHPSQGITQHTEPHAYTADVQIESRIGVGVELYPDQVAPGLPVLVNAFASSAVPLSDVRISADVVDGDGNVVGQVLLRDDGRGTDLKAGDGMFSGLVVATRAAGSYSVHAELHAALAGGAPIARSTRASFQVEDVVLDADLDNLPDRWEAHFGTDLDVHDANADYDADLLSCSVELQLGSHPLLADSDGDGALDGMEADSSSSLTGIDADRGGLADVIEIEWGLSPSNPIDDDAQPALQLELDPARVEFGTLEVGVGQRRMLVIRNRSVESHSFALDLSDDAGGVFQLEASDLPTTLAPFATAFAVVRATPLEDGRFEGALEVSSGDTVWTVPLSVATPVAPGLDAGPDGGPVPPPGDDGGAGVDDAGDSGAPPEPDAGVPSGDAGPIAKDAGSGGGGGAGTDDGCSCDASANAGPGASWLLAVCLFGLALLRPRRRR